MAVDFVRRRFRWRSLRQFEREKKENLIAELTGIVDVSSVKSGVSKTSWASGSLDTVSVRP